MPSIPTIKHKDNRKNQMEVLENGKKQLDQSKTEKA